MDKLYLIITGAEHSGTTFLSQIIYSIPEVYSAFETGLLLRNDFRECKPFCEWIHKEKGNHWGVPKTIDFFDKKLTFDDKYKLLFEHKGGGDSFVQNMMRDSPVIVDKTPAYIRNLQFVRKNSKNIPIIITLKSSGDMFISYVVKRKMDLSVFVDYLNQLMNTMHWIHREKPKNLYVFNYRNIIRPGFGNTLKGILPDMINLKEVDINHENFRKRCGENKYHNAGWKKTQPPKRTMIPMKLKEKLITYDRLLKEITSQTTKIVNKLNIEYESKFQNP